LFAQQFFRGRQEVTESLFLRHYKKSTFAVDFLYCYNRRKRYKNMKKAARIVGVLGIAIGIFVTAPLAVAADIDQNRLECAVQSEVEVVTGTPSVCDLGIQKQVAVNNGSFNDADTTGTAAKATIGSTVTYKITLSSFGSTVPYGVYYVKDVLPAQLQYVSHDTAAGEFDTETNLWVLDDNSELPAVLTITATVVSGGLIDNIAALEFFAYCQYECVTNEYIDDNPANDSDHAYINTSSTPQVLGASTASTTTNQAVLAETGSSLFLQSAVAVLITIMAVAVAFKKNARNSTIDQ